MNEDENSSTELLLGRNLVRLRISWPQMLRGWKYDIVLKKRRYDFHYALRRIKMVSFNVFCGINLIIFYVSGKLDNDLVNSQKPYVEFFIANRNHFQFHLFIFDQSWIILPALMV